jgi:hypothetical protein
MGQGGQRFVTQPFKTIGICRVLRYEEEGGVSKILQNCVT